MEKKQYIIGISLAALVCFIVFYFTIYKETQAEQRKQERLACEYAGVTKGYSALEAKLLCE